MLIAKQYWFTTPEGENRQEMRLEPPNQKVPWRAIETRALDLGIVVVVWTDEEFIAALG